MAMDGNTRAILAAGLALMTFSIYNYTTPATTYYVVEVAHVSRDAVLFVPWKLSCFAKYTGFYAMNRLRYLDSLLSDYQALHSTDRQPPVSISYLRTITNAATELAWLTARAGCYTTHMLERIILSPEQALTNAMWAYNGSYLGGDYIKSAARDFARTAFSIPHPRWPGRAVMTEPRAMTNWCRTHSMLFGDDIECRRWSGLACRNSVSLYDDGSVTGDTTVGDRCYELYRSINAYCNEWASTVTPHAPESTMVCSSTLVSGHVGYMKDVMVPSATDGVVFAVNVAFLWRLTDFGITRPSLRNVSSVVYGENMASVMGAFESRTYAEGLGTSELPVSGDISLREALTNITHAEYSREAQLTMKYLALASHHAGSRKFGVYDEASWARTDIALCKMVQAADATDDYPLASNTTRLPTPSEWAVSTAAIFTNIM